MLVTVEKQSIGSVYAKVLEFKRKFQKNVEIHSEC